MKIRFIQHESVLPKRPNIRFNYVVSHFQCVWVGWCTYHLGLKKVEEIVIVKQKNALKTAQIFVHELAHAVAYTIFGVRNWHVQLIQRYL